jgi:ubiquinone/menaquinone biosynthesis C-methylase UbiE
MMPQQSATKEEKTKDLYDRIADVQNLAMKINGYRNSVSRFLRGLDLEIGPESLVLDAGCGTGIVTLGFEDAGYRPRHVAALDLSHKSLSVARDEFRQKRRSAKRTGPVQGNVLEMPFADGTFDLLLSCGVLEYVPLNAGLAEAARVMKPGAKLVFIPVKPSVVGAVLELLYNFKMHPLESVREAAGDHFNILGNYDFPITEPIGWSKTIFLLEKR